MTYSGSCGAVRLGCAAPSGEQGPAIRPGAPLEVNTGRASVRDVPISSRRIRLSAAEVLLIGIFCAGFSGSAQLAASERSPTSLPESTHTLEIQGDAQPTKAWTEFCARAPAECTVNLSEPPAIVLTHAAWVMVTSVNVRVNRSIQGMTDMEHWGTDDRWDYPNDGKGDCEDIQLLKRRILVRNGVPRRAMRMTVVIDELGQGHAVLVLRTDRGDLVLDNKHDAILPWERTGYVFLKRESSDRNQWVSFGDKGARFTTAAPD